VSDLAVPRATVYRHRVPQQASAPQRSGLVGPVADAALLEHIRAVLAASPFHGEGHRKVWARLRIAGIRTSRRRECRNERFSRRFQHAGCRFLLNTRGDGAMPSSRVLTFSDPYDYAKSARGAHVRTFVTTRGDFVGTTMPISLHRLWMNRSETSLPHIKHVALDGRRSGISFLADRDQPSEYLGGTELSSGEIAWSCSAEFHRRIPAGSRWATMSLVPEDLAAAGRALTGREPAAPRAAHVTRPPPALMSRLMNLHRAASDLAATAPDILGHPEVAKAIEQELVRTMVACLMAAETGAGSRSCRLGGAVMRRFEQLLEAHPNEPLYITEICARIGVTDRALRMYCQEHLGMSPHRYLWLRRMHLARRALALADARVETVTEIANDYGFGELGRFAVSYRNLFGETPSVTLRRFA
jgi:AraC-like DNA-binding protein